MYIHGDSSRFPQRKNPRMKHFDYTSANYYFVTICTRDKKCLFGTPNQLNTLGMLAQQGIVNISAHFPGVTIDKYVIMPNHIHAILIIGQPGIHLSNVIGQYKSFVSKEAHKLHSNLHLWQSSFHDHIIRSQSAYEKIWLYIESNPSNWEKDCFYLTSHNHSSATAGS